MDFKRILVAVNTTNGRDAAFERALALAQASGAELYVLHAVPANRRFSARAAERLQRTQELRARAERAGVRVQTVEQHGDPADVIVLHATSRDADLIVMGSETGHGWFRRRRSPVAERVLRRTDRAALVVAGEGQATPGFERVLVAVDLDGGSARVVGGALALAAGPASHVSVSVMHVVTGLEPATAVQSHARWIVPEYRTHVVEHARKELQSLVAETGRNLDANMRIATGPAAQGILEQAEVMDADVIVVGKSRGFKPLGSTAVRVLRRNERALLVVPTTDASIGTAGTAADRQRAAQRRRCACGRVGPPITCFGSETARAALLVLAPSSPIGSQPLDRAIDGGVGVRAGRGDSHDVAAVGFHFDHARHAFARSRSRLARQAQSRISDPVDVGHFRQSGEQSILRVRLRLAADGVLCNHFDAHSLTPLNLLSRQRLRQPSKAYRREVRENGGAVRLQREMASFNGK